MSAPELDLTQARRIIFEGMVSREVYQQWDERVLARIGQLPREPFKVFPFRPQVTRLLNENELYFQNMLAAHTAQIKRGDMFHSIMLDARLKQMAAQSVTNQYELRTEIYQWLEVKDRQGRMALLVATMGAGKTTTGAGIYEFCKHYPDLEFIAFVDESELFRYEPSQVGFVSTASGFEFPAQVFKDPKTTFEKIDAVISSGKKPVIFMGEILFVFMENGEINQDELDNFVDGLMRRDVFVVLDILSCFATSEMSPVAKALITVLKNREYPVRSQYLFAMSSHYQTMAAMVFPYKLNLDTGLVEIHDPRKPVIGVIRTSDTTKLTLQNPYALFPAGYVDWLELAKDEKTGNYIEPSQDALFMITALAEIGLVSLPLLNAVQSDHYNQIIEHLGLPGTHREIDGVLRSHVDIVRPDGVFTGLN